jgi:hypothetical protein
MFTLTLLYIIFYLLTVLSLLILIFSQTPIYLITHLSITNFMVFIQKYKVEKTIYLWLFFCLTGLPPVGLFFIKFNIFFFLLYQTHFLNIILIFFFFFFNMLYYLQVFNFRNFKKPMYCILTPKIFNVWGTNSTNNQVFSSYNTYKLTLFVINVTLFFCFTLFFVSDYFLVLNII